MRSSLCTFDSVKLGVTSVQSEARSSVVQITSKLIYEFRDWLVETGMPAATADSYANALKQICKRLPKDKAIRRGTLQELREKFQAEEYAPATINFYFCAANRLLEYCGCRELQVVGILPVVAAEQPELSRSEYLKLLTAARRLKKQREYLFIKLFATTGITISELVKLTPPAVRRGEFEVHQNRVQQVKHIPPSLQRELLDYAEKIGRIEGPIFINSKGTAPYRNDITTSISALAEPAGLPKEKCNPSCLRKLYLTTRQEIANSFEPFINKTYDDIVEKEQALIGWDLGSSF